MFKVEANLTVKKYDINIHTSEGVVLVNQLDQTTSKINFEMEFNTQSEADAFLSAMLGKDNCVVTVVV